MLCNHERISAVLCRKRSARLVNTGMMRLGHYASCEKKYGKMAESNNSRQGILPSLEKIKMAGTILFTTAKAGHNFQF